MKINKAELHATLIQNTYWKEINSEFISGFSYSEIRKFIFIY